jgi:zinc transport system ATP-binding protein
LELMAEPALSVDAPLLAAEGISAGYGRDLVIEDVSLRVDPGEFVALVGPNGSGKSTLLNVLLGAIEPRSGSIRLFGEDPDRFHARWRLGFVPQRPTLESEVPATVREIVTSGRIRQRGWWRRQSVADRTAIAHAIESVGLAEVAEQPLNELSVGQQQRAFIARAFASGPDLLVLDEPIAGIDRASQRRFRESLVHLQREHGAGVLLVSHELSAVADVIDRIIVLKRTVLFDGSPAELASSGVSLGIHRDDLPLWLEGLG